MREEAKRNYGFKRFFRKLALTIAKFGMLPGSFRVKLVKFAGVVFVDSSDVFIGENVTFDNIYPEYIIIGKKARITAGTKILTHFLDVSKPPFSFYTGKVIIGNNVFIGANSLIVKECSIGNNVVIAAGSVITKDIPDNWIVGGVPAKKIGERAIDNETY
jgi:acetyltransferase-like isoleucine patch superfamily enzyme